MKKAHQYIAGMPVGDIWQIPPFYFFLKKKEDKMNQKEERKMWSLAYKLLKGGYTAIKGESYYYALKAIYNWSRLKERGGIVRDDNTKTSI